ncbi:tRNA modification GTPase TrmE [Panus rudis PR-1116 ss-1]|nr:tRNA modification GTPase TrmE [Panus rudis PR-1116 ss-1]
MFFSRYLHRYHPVRTSLYRSPQLSRLRIASGFCPPRLAPYTTTLPNEHARLCKAGLDSVKDQQHIIQSDSQRRTIYALASPLGKAGVAVIRVSGPDALLVWQQVVRPAGFGSKHSSPKPWKMYRCSILHPSTHELLDEGLAVYFKGPRSFTSEDTVELHIHSGRAVVSSCLAALSSLPYCRLAEPGEFTRRAFLSGKLDLTQVEGLKDLINSETESQRKLALQATTGVFRTWLENLRKEIIACLGHIEALIDFGEEDIEANTHRIAKERAQAIIREIQNHLSSFKRGEIMRTGLKVAIFGPPNVGKSSLFNYLAQREAAIVSNVPGTTRDVLEISIDIGGIPVIIIDTAGIRDTDDQVEKLGIQRAIDRLEGSDMLLCMLAAENFHAHAGFPPDMNLPPTLKSRFSASNVLFLINKCDLLTPQNLEALSGALRHYQKRAWIVSLSTGDGLDLFIRQLGEIITTRYRTDDKLSEPLLHNERHRVHLQQALEFLQAFIVTPDSDIILGAEELRYAAQAIGRISGRIDTEDILDVIFRDFCIGK